MNSNGRTTRQPSLYSSYLSLVLLVALAPRVFSVEQASLSSADSLARQGRFREAAGAYRAIVEKDNSSSAAWLGLVESHLKADDVKAAEESSAQALSFLPQSAVVHAAHGDVLFRQGLLNEAEQEYEQALRLDDKCGRAWLGIGRMFSGNSRPGKAKEAFAKAHDLSPNDGDVLYRWAVELPYPKSVQELEKYVAEFHFDAGQERRNREFLALIKALAGRSVWNPASGVSHAEVKLQPIVPGPNRMLGFALKANLNGKANATLLLDTASSWATISKRLADKIGARRLSEQALEGTGGENPSASYLAWVDKITIGEVEFHDCIVHVSALNNNSGTDGLIGSEVFEHNLLTLDFANRKLVLDPLPASSDDSSLPKIRLFAPQKIGVRQFFRSGHLLLVPAELNRHVGLFVLDSGSNATLLARDFAAAAGPVRAANMRVTGLSGSAGENAVAENAILQFSGVPEKPQDLITTDLHGLSRNLGTEVSGMIGFSSLGKMRVVIDYRGGSVTFGQ